MNGDAGAWCAAQRAHPAHRDDAHYAHRAHCLSFDEI